MKTKTKKSEAKRNERKKTHVQRKKHVHAKKKSYRLGLTDRSHAFRPAVNSTLISSTKNRMNPYMRNFHHQLARQRCFQSAPVSSWCDAAMANCEHIKICHRSNQNNRAHSLICFQPSRTLDSINRPLQGRVGTYGSRRTCGLCVRQTSGLRPRQTPGHCPEQKYVGI